MWAPAGIVAIIFYEVFMRYILFKPTLWVNEMSLWIGGMIYVTSGLLCDAAAKPYQNLYRL